MTGLSFAGECGFKNKGLQPLVIADNHASLETISSIRKPNSLIIVPDSGMRRNDDSWASCGVLSPMRNKTKNPAKTGFFIKISCAIDLIRGAVFNVFTSTIKNVRLCFNFSSGLWPNRISQNQLFFLSAKVHTWTFLK